MYKIGDNIHTDGVIPRKNNENSSILKNTLPTSEETKKLPICEPVNPAKYIVRQNLIHSRCVLCDCNFFASESKNHIETKTHADTEKRYGCENFEFHENTYYYCKCCDCKINDLDNLYLHAKGTNHSSNMSSKSDEMKQNVEKTIEKLDKIPDTISIAKSHWSIVEIKNDVYQCSICDSSISLSASQIEAHKNEKSHSDALKTYDHIMPIGKMFYCETCKLFVLNVKDIRSHVTKSSHLQSVISFENKCSSTTEKRENFEKSQKTLRVEEKIDDQKLKHDEISRKLENLDISKNSEKSEISKKSKNEEIMKKMENVVITKNEEIFEDSKKPEVPEISKKSEILEIPKKSENPEFSKKSSNLEFAKKSENLEFPKRSENLEFSEKSENLESPKKSENLELPKIPKTLELPKNLKNPELSKIPKNPELQKIPKNPELPKIPQNSELPKIPKNPELPKNLKNPELPKIPKNPELQKIPKNPELPKIPQNSELPKIPKNPELPKTSENLVTSFDPKSTKDYCIIRTSSTEYKCQICSLKLSNLCDIDEHIHDTQHAESMKKYGCESINLNVDNSYYCQSCDCKIAGETNVFPHICGKRHAKCFQAMKKIQETEIKTTIACVPSELSILLSKVISMEFEKLVKSFQARNEKRRWLRDTTITRRCMRDMQNITCNYCNVVVSNSAELHSHLANHLSNEFVNWKYEKNNIVPYSHVLRGFNNVKCNNHDDETRKTTCDGTSNAEKYPGPMNLGDDDDETSESDDDDNTETGDSPKKSLFEIVQERLYYDKDYIYEMRDKLASVELGMKLCFVNDNKTIYCLVCGKNVASTFQSYFEHLSSIDHTANLRDMERDDALFDRVVGQYSELKLAHEYMEEITESHVRCLICNINIDNDDESLALHIHDTEHQQIRQETLINSRQNFQEVRSRIQCNWYNVEKYWCVPCSRNFTTEIGFVRHLETSRHCVVTKKIGTTESDEKCLIYDFCPPCGLLWYGYSCTYAYHCDLSSHKWLLRDGHYMTSELPIGAKKILSNPELYANEICRDIDESSPIERGVEKILVKQLEDTLRGNKYEEVRAYEIGSRIYGIGTTDSVLDVFLDCGDMYEGNLKSSNNNVNLLTNVRQCLSSDPVNWDTKENSTNRRITILRARHNSTGLMCDIFLENGLPVEMTKLLKSINDVFPPCRKMIIFLKNWLIKCNLSGHERITNYALCWYVIFYLQTEKILPSIAKLIKMKNESRLIAGWEVGVTRNFGYNVAASNLSFNELLARFFILYGEFDFRRDVACPLIGGTVKKRAFTHQNELPSEMLLYVESMNLSNDPEPLRVDSPMCIQDPFVLRDNITRNVGKVYLRRFRAYCVKSLDVLRSF